MVAIVKMEINNPYPSYTELYLHELDRLRFGVLFYEEGTLKNLENYTVTAKMTIDDVIITDNLDVEVYTGENTDYDNKLLIVNLFDYDLFAGDIKIEFELGVENNDEDSLLHPIRPLIIKATPSIFDNASVIPESRGTVADMLQLYPFLQRIATTGIENTDIKNNAVIWDKLSVSLQTMLNDYDERIDGKLDDGIGTVKTTNIDDNQVTYEKLSTALQDKIDNIATNPLFVENKGSLSASASLDSAEYCTIGGVYQFIALPPLSSAIGVGGGTLCELRYVNGYQVITVTDTQQIFARKINSISPSFNADSWIELIDPSDINTRISTLESTVGAVDSALQAIIDGGASNE